MALHDETPGHDAPHPLLVVGQAAGAPVDVFLDNGLRAIRAHLGMEVAFVSEFVGTERVFRHVDTASDRCPIAVGDSGPLEASYCQRVVDGRLPELMQDAAENPVAAAIPGTLTLPVGAHLSVPIRLSDGRVYGTLCCFSTYPDHSLNQRDLATLRVFAEMAAAHLEADLDRRLRAQETFARVGEAIGGAGLTMVFQPIVDIAGSHTIGFEALARFRQGPVRPPDAWFAEAAQAGLGLELELAAVRLALQELDRVPAPAYLGLNVSPDTAVSRELADLLPEADSGRVVLEITEHVAIEAYERLEAPLARLRRRGVRVAVDDAGAGYASFRHILRLRPDVIKLDVTLTRDIDTDRPRRALAAALIAFAGDTGSTIVAEGVETTGELNTLRLLGVTAAQGFILGRPGQLAPTGRPGALSPSASL